MTEHDEELRSILRRWEAPVPRSQLDDRVWESYVKSRPLYPGRWAGAAAAIAVIGVAAIWLQRPQPVSADRQCVSVVTIADATGFRPLPNGKIEVIKGKP